VEIRAKDGRAVIEPERDPERIIERMESLIEEAAADRRSHPYEDLDLFAREHAETIRRQARTSARDDE